MACCTVHSITSLTRTRVAARGVDTDLIIVTIMFAGWTLISVWNIGKQLLKPLQRPCYCMKICEFEWVTCRLPSQLQFTSTVKRFHTNNMKTSFRRICYLASQLRFYLWLVWLYATVKLRGNSSTKRNAVTRVSSLDFRLNDKPSIDQCDFLHTRYFE